jgi:hypothetical protein
MDKRAAANADLAYRVATWLQGNGCTVQVAYKAPFGYEVHYTLKLDIKPQPPVRIDGSVVFPKGSQEDVVFAFLAGMLP